MKKSKKYSIILLFGMIIGMSIFMTACSSSNEKEVLKIDDIKIGMNELMYYIYQKEEEGNSREQFYQDSLEDSYWDILYDKERTFRQVAKDEVMENAIMYTIFEKKAKEVGYSLTEQEKETVSKEAKQFYTSLSETQKEKMGLTVEQLTVLKEKILLGSKYYDEVMNSISIDEEFVTSEINAEKCRQYDISYIHIPIAEYDENANRIEYDEYDEKQKKEAYKKILALLPKAKETKDFNDLISEDEMMIFEVGQIGFSEGDELFGAVFEKEALKLQNGQVADKIIEEEDGYYIVRMDNNNSKEAYDEAVAQAMEVARYEVFQEVYTQIKKDYNIQMNTSLWDDVTLGTIIYEPKEEIE